MLKKLILTFGSLLIMTTSSNAANPADTMLIELSTGTGMGGSDKPDLEAEFTDYEYKRGTIGMARTANPNSANSQFFICFTDTGCSFLTGQYTVWGQVTDGMEYVDQIAQGEPPANPDKIVKATIASDANAEEKSEAAE